MKRQKDTTTYPIQFLMVDADDHVSPKTGLTPTVKVSKNGGAFADANGVVSEIGYGIYKLAGHADDRDTLGEMLIHAEAAGADNTDTKVMIVDYDPFTELDISGLATSSALSTVGGNVSAIPTNPLLTNDVRLDNLDAKVSDVKAKTDKIPNQPAPAGEYDTQLDATISSRLAESSYTAPDNAGIGQIQTDIGNLNDITVGDILDGVVEGTYTIQDYLRLMASVLFGKLDGGGTFTLTFRDPDDTTDRVIATVDANANRTDIITNVL